MALTTTLKLFLNGVLKKINLRIDTLTVKNIERRRLERLDESGHFNKALFNAPSIDTTALSSILDQLQQHKQRFDQLTDPLRNDVGYTFKNSYFSSPDAEVLYAFVRKFNPKTIIEIGSGNSTQISRQAILDGNLNTRLISIDPQPRTDIDRFTDTIKRQPVETLDVEIFNRLEAGDIFFIDASHDIKIGNDVVFVYLKILPRLPAGVIVHIHDIFLPYEYPKEWVMEKDWESNEQYLVQSMLTFGDSFDILWAGYFLQQTRRDFSQYFPYLSNGSNGIATSLWLRKK